MENLDNPMRRQVFSLPDLIRQQYKELEPKTRKVFSASEIFSFKKIILTGCGDSYAAALATKHLFETFAKVPTEVVNTIELSRTYNTDLLDHTPNNPLVIAISHSGSVARVGEAVERLNKCGAFTLGITSNAESYLGMQSKRNLMVDIPKLESAPGVRSYLVSMLALTLLAVRFGEVKGTYTMDEAKTYRKEIINQADVLEMMLPTMDEKAKEVAQRWANLEAFDFIGAGSDFATAFYGHAKIYEACGRYAMYVNTEEWLHLNFFMRNVEKIGTVIIASGANPAYSRASELIGYVQQLGRPTMIVTDRELPELNGLDHVIVIPSSTFSFLNQFAPIALVAGYISKLIGEEYGRGTKDQWSFAKGAQAIKNSEIVIY